MNGKDKVSMLLVLVLLAGSAQAGNGLLAYRGAPESVEAAYAAVKPGLYAKARLNVNPARKYVKKGDVAVYEVKLTDGHPALKCSSENNEECVGQEHTYSIYVSGLPFDLDYPQQVSVPAGGNIRFKLAVDTASYTLLAADAAAAGEDDGDSDDDAEDHEITAATANKILVGRPYGFTVTAEMDDASAVDKALLYVGNVVPNPPQVPGEKVAVKLYGGWNIVSLPGVGRYLRKSVADDSGVSVVTEELAAEVESLAELHPRKYFFVYLKDEGRYASFREASKLMGPLNFRRYLVQNAFWVYTPEDDELVFSIWRFTSYNGMPVSRGWNFIPVTRDMAGVTLDEIRDGCEFTSLYLWDELGQDWIKIGVDHVFGDGEVYSGMVAKAQQDCRLGDVTPNTPTPPPLPD